MNSGIVKDMPAAKYHAVLALSASGLKEFARTPAHYVAMRAEEKVETPAMAFGTAYHLAVLEPEKFRDTYIERPEGIDYRIKTGKEWRDAQTKTILTAEEFFILQTMQDQIYGHETVSKLIAGAEHEVSLFWDDPLGFPCKARADIVNHELKIIADLKSTTDAGPVPFAKTIANLRYHWQAYWYRRGMKVLTGENPYSFIFVPQEKVAPYAVAAYLCSEDMLYKAHIEIEAMLPGFAQCWKSGKWPAYPDRVMEI